MLKSKTRWNVRKRDQQKVQELVDKLNITPLVASLLMNRGVDNEETARLFLFGDDEQFHDPFSMNQMDVTVKRINKAIAENELILIYGDYDADGVTSTALLMSTLQDLGANVQFYIPNRFTEGYGPNEAAFRQAASAGVSLIITVDTGISALHEAAIAKELGMDLIITDHHEPGDELPLAYAIIHPKMPESKYPFQELAGVGVAFKLAHALYGKVPIHLLDLVAIGTIADLVSLRGENRLLAKRGIEKLCETKRPGLQAIFNNSRLNQAEIDEETIGFVIAPRLNAVGRLRQADLAVELLLTNDIQEAKQLADEIEALNKERQLYVQTITEEAIAIAESELENENTAVLVIAKEGWHEGVIGIVASRLVDRFYRPAIVLSTDQKAGLAKGSARSIAGFDLFQNLSKLHDILPHFGGHPMAAGMTLQIENINDLRINLNELANQQLTKADFKPISELDSVVHIEDIQLAAIEEMNLLSPFGMDNPKPKILIENANIASMRKIGAEKNHLKMLLKNEEEQLDAIGFQMGHLFDHISQDAKISVIGELAINEWNNIRKPQIFLRDMAIENWQLFDIRGLKSHRSLCEMVPSENRKWIVFHEDTVNKIKIPQNEEICFIQSEETALQTSLLGNTIFTDLPSSQELLLKLIEGKSLERVYVHFYKEETTFFSTMPTRDHFKWYYAFLRKNGAFDLGKQGNDLAKYRGWTRETINFMSQVFFELQFAKINNGIITLSAETLKRDLTESPTYQRKQAQYALEKELLYSSLDQLKNWFDARSQGSAETEEAIREWI